MNEALKRYVDAATGLGNLTKSRAEKVARQLVKQGEAASDQVGELVEEILDRQRKNREAITEMVRAETKRAVRRMGLATTSEVERLETEVSELKKELSDARASAASSDTGTRGAAKKAPTKATKKKASPKQPATKKKASKKSSKKKTSTKKAASKKSGGKKSAPKKSTTKKKASKKSTKKSSGGSGS